MREEQGDLWTHSADIRVITTNGEVNEDGDAIMGTGVALQAARKWQQFPYELGILLREQGNKVHMLRFKNLLGESIVWTFPVKEQWRDLASLDLIAESARQLVIAANAWELAVATPVTIVLPRPGCDSGRRRWSEVRPILLRYLDDRFVVVHLGPKSVPVAA